MLNQEGRKKASRLSAFKISPATAKTAVQVPAQGALILTSIFIASTQNCRSLLAVSSHMYNL